MLKFLTSRKTLTTVAVLVGLGAFISTPPAQAVLNQVARQLPNLKIGLGNGQSVDINTSALVSNVFAGNFKEGFLGAISYSGSNLFSGNTSLLDAFQSSGTFIPTTESLQKLQVDVANRDVVLDPLAANGAIAGEAARNKANQELTAIISGFNLGEDGQNMLKTTQKTVVATNQDIEDRAIQAQNRISTQGALKDLALMTARDSQIKTIQMSEWLREAPSRHLDYLHNASTAGALNQWLYSKQIEPVGPSEQLFRNTGIASHVPVPTQ